MIKALAAGHRTFAGKLADAPLAERREDVAQLGQDLDVQRRIDEPVVGQRAPRPVGRAVPLLEREAEQLLHQRAQPDAGAIQIKVVLTP